MTSPYAVRPQELVRAFLMVAALFLMMLMGLSHILHMCHLRSWWVGAPLTVAPIAPVLYLMGKARHLRLSLFWFCLFMPILFLAHYYFLRWLHSDAFPEWLLTSDPRMTD